MKWLSKLWGRNKPDVFDKEIERRIQQLDQYLSIHSAAGARMDPTYWEMSLKAGVYREVQKLYRTRYREMQ